VARRRRGLRVLWSFNAQQGCWYPAVGLVLELRARGHEVVGLSRPTVAPTLAALDIELRADQMSPWPSDLGLDDQPPTDLDQALRRKNHVVRAHRDHVAGLLKQERFLPGGAIVVLSIPHGMVLPRVRAAVATGGLGTVTRTACAGRPAVLVPRANDQFRVAESAVAAGMAVRVLPDDVDEERLGQALDQALGDRRLVHAGDRSSGSLRPV